MKNITLTDIREKLTDGLAKARQYATVLFCVFIGVIYIFVIYRVQVLNSSEPSDADVASKSKTAQVPHIDPKVLSQLQQLQDNSVSVQSLFNQARDNPFGE
jgi:hypothetical protein